MDPSVAPPVDAPADAPDPDAPENDAAHLSTGEVNQPAMVAASLVALLVMTIPVAMAHVVWATPTGALDWSRRVQVAPFDLLLVAIAGWSIFHREAVAAVFRAPAVRFVSIAFGVAYAISMVVHPSWLGVALGLRLAAGVGVIACCGVAFGLPQARSLLLGTIAAVGAAQAGLGMVQAWRGSVLGVSPLDWGFDLFAFGSSHAGQGGLPHPYHLTSFLVMTQGAALLGLRHTRASRVPWLLCLAVVSAGVAVTYSRAGLIGQVALVACALLGRRERRILVPAAAAVALGFLIGVVGFGDGWVARSETTTGQQAGASIDSDRRTRLAEAGELIESSPVFGIGPGRYVEELHESFRDTYQPAHNLIAHEAAEYGIPGGIVVVALLALLGLRVLRGGAWTAVVVVPMIPLLLLGSTGYILATSLAVSALWLGLARGSLEPADPASP